MFALALTLTLSLSGAEPAAGPKACAGVPVVAGEAAIGAGGASLIGAAVMVALWNGSHDVATLDILAPAVIILGGLGGGIFELDGNGYFLSGAIGGWAGGLIGASVAVIASLLGLIGYFGVLSPGQTVSGQTIENGFINAFAVGAVVGAALGAEMGTATVEE